MNIDTPSARTSRRSAGWHSAVRLILAALSLAIINYIAFKHYTHKDLSASQYYTLSPKTIDVLKKLDSPVTIYTFMDERNVAQSEQVSNLLKEYQQAAGKNIVLEKIDPLYDSARAADLQKKLHFDGNDHLVILQYKEKDHSPRFVKQEDLFDINPMTGQIGAFKGEQQLTATIVSLIEGKVSKVYFTQGHGEHPIDDITSTTGYGFVGQSLKNENVDTATLNLAQKGEVPSDADAVVIAGPSISFSPIEVDALDKYLSANGKLLVLLDPYVVSGLDDLLKKYGLKYEDDMVLFRAPTETGEEITVPLAAIIQGGFSADQPITAKFAQANLQLLIQNARSVTLLPDEKGQPNPKVQFLLQTDPTAWGWISKDGTAPADPKQLTYNKISDIAGPVTVAAAYDGGMITDPTTKASAPGTRVVVGSSRFLENDLKESVGANFFTNSLDWLVKKNAILDIAPKKPQEYGVSLSPMQFRTVFWCSVIIIPGLALLAGILTWFSRRK